MFALAGVVSRSVVSVHGQAKRAPINVDFLMCMTVPSQLRLNFDISRLYNESSESENKVVSQGPTGKVSYF